MQIVLNQLLRAMPALPYSRGQKYIDMLNAAMARTDTNTELRIAAYLSQVGHESMDFYYMQEIASGEAYEGRLSLGNTQPGDGKRFKGRGPLQITGRDNYTRFAAWSGLDCVNHPELLEDPANGFLASSWFWMTRDINALADKGDIKAVSIAVNGRHADGLPNGWNDRLIRYTRALEAMK